MRCLAARLVVIVTVAMVAIATGQATWPPGPTITCGWNDTSSELLLSWSPTAGAPPLTEQADVYEVQLAPSPFAQASAVYTTVDTNVSLGLDLLLPKTTYFVSARSHAGWAFRTGHQMGVDSWGKSGAVVACTTGARLVEGDAQKGTHIDAVKEAKTFTFESWRISEFSTNVDYLLNHDGADAGGSMLLVTGLSQYEFYAGESSLYDSWLGASTSEMVISRYCIDAIKPDTPGTVTTRGDPNFADYVSCNNQVDKSSSNCSCAVFEDRQWGRLSLEPACHIGSTKLPCPVNPGNECSCTCTTKATEVSSLYTGMINVFGGGDNTPVGKWYSHPEGGACRAGEPLGYVRPDGSRCTWRVRPMVRVVRGWQLYAAGLNATGLRCDPSEGVGSSCAPLVEQIHQNQGISESVMARAPFQPWQCK